MIRNEKKIKDMKIQTGKGGNLIVEKYVFETIQHCKYPKATITGKKRLKYWNSVITLIKRKGHTLHSLSTLNWSFSLQEQKYDHIQQ